MTTYDVSGRVSLGLLHEDDETGAAVAHQMAPFTAVSDGCRSPVDVVLDFGGGPAGRYVDVQNPARDGLRTAFDGRAQVLLAGGRACAIVRSAGPRLTLCPDRGFPLGLLFRTVVRPALQTAAVGHDAVAVHSAAVEIDGRAALVAGWSESGKTETALALMETGARWVSDKWTFLGTDGEASTFPISVGVRRWVLPYLPRLAAGLPRQARFQMAAAAGLATASSPLRRRGSRFGAAAALADRVVALADRAALTQQQIRAVYGETTDPTRRVPLGTLILLTTVPGADVSVDEGTASWAADRLARSGVYERNDWYMLGDRWAYADAPHAPEDRERSMAEERLILKSALDRARVLHVRAPFPVDPRRVADAIRGAM